MGGKEIQVRDREMGEMRRREGLKRETLRDVDRSLSSVAEVQFPGERAGWYGRPILVKVGKDSNAISVPPSPSSISPFL